MKQKFITALSSTCFVLLISSSLLAQGSTDQAEREGIRNKRIGTAAASELLIPTGGRGMALGGAMVTNAVGVDALHWNPAGLARMGGSAQGMFSSMNYIADINVSYGALALDFGGIQVGASIKLMDFGDIPFTTVDDPEGLVGRTYSPKFFTLGFSAAKTFTDAITAGATMKLISEDLQRVQGSGFAIDVGVQYHGIAGFNGLNLGVALHNVGPAMSFDGPALLRTAGAIDGRRPAQFYKSEAAEFELPSYVEIGLGYTNSVNDQLTWSVLGSYENHNLAIDSYKGAGEAVYSMESVVLAARAGYEAKDTGEFDESIFGATYGFGLTYKSSGMDITIDYAYRATDYFEANNMFSIILDF